MQTEAEQKLSSRQRSRLRRAREDGCLEVRGAEGPGVLRIYGSWCWRMRLPLIWFERNSLYSRYGAVRLDLFTTARQLTDQGKAALRELAPGQAAISPHDGVWRRVPYRQLPELAGRILRAAVRPENCEIVTVRRIEAPRKGPAKVIEMERARAASG